MYRYNVRVSLQPLKVMEPRTRNSMFYGMERYEDNLPQFQFEYDLFILNRFLKNELYSGGSGKISRGCWYSDPSLYLFPPKKSERDPKMAKTDL